MQSFAGRTAVVTGAASGMGLAMARRFAAEGMNVVMADVEAAALEAAATSITPSGGKLLAVPTDVSVAADVERLARRAAEEFGNVHILVNNAGVHRTGAAWEQSLDDWKWILGVNLWGVIHGVHAFVPGMLAHGEECHVVTTASAAGLVAGAFSPSYAASKFGAVAIAECLASELAAIGNDRMGVSVLCPGGVATNIFDSARNRPADLPEQGSVRPEAAARFAAMANTQRTDQATPDQVATLVFEAIRDNRFYILPMQPQYKDGIRARLRRIAAALDAASDVGV